MTTNLNREFPILEFDPDGEALIEPSRILDQMDVPERCVICFFQEVIAGLDEAGALTKLKELKSEMGSHWLSEIGGYDQRVAIYHPGVGAPLAAGYLDEVIALGCRKFIAIGSCGVLDSRIAPTTLIVPTAAVRDEGTSYHYLPPAREVEPDASLTAKLVETLKRREPRFIRGKTWTTDGFYRETRSKIELRRAEGCVSVEMEAAAFMATARFRGVPFAQLLYASDDLGGATWDPRRETSRRDVRRLMFDLAVETLTRS